MSQTAKIVLGIAIVAVILLAAFYYWHVAKAPTASPAVANPEVSTLPSGSSTSDAAIQEDLTAIDAQLQSVHQDNTDASASVQTAVSQ
jgi:hypothetical protein